MAIKPMTVKPAATAAATPPPGATLGIDISSHNPEPAWATLKSSGTSFVGIKATEGDYYVNTATTSPVVQPGYATEVTHAASAGMAVMPYAFANPYQGDGTSAHTSNGSGTCQADYAWAEVSSVTSPSYASTGMMPVALDIEQDPYVSQEGANANSCYGLTPSAMVTWIGQFVTEMQKVSGRPPVIYTNPSFWTDCTGNSSAFTANRLWLADWTDATPPSVAGWNSPMIWQYTDAATVTGESGTVDGDSAASGIITLAVPANLSTVVGTPVAPQMHATDTNPGLSPMFSATGLPSGTSISSSGLISGWPYATGTFHVQVTATDTNGAFATVVFTWTVKAAAASGTTGQIRQHGGSGKCLDDPASKTTTATAMDLATCTGQSNQAWTSVQDGTIRVLGHCLTASGAYVLLYPCNGSIAEQWKAGSDSQLVDVRYGNCLTGPAGAVANGTRPTLGACANSTSAVNQHWERAVAPVVSGVAARCLGVSGTSAELLTCANVSAQHWLDAWNAQIVVNSTTCLTESGTTAGSAITVTPCANAASQHWKLASAGPIASELVSTTSGLCVTVPAGQSASGTKLVLGTCSTALESTWRFTT